MAGRNMSKPMVAGVGILGLMLTSSTWASDAPCTPPAPTPESASICVYNVGKKPAFSTLRVVVNGTVEGKLARKQPWLLVNVRPGATVVGIDIGNTPQVRRRVEALAGQVTYLRYVFTTSIKTGFFDTTSEAQALLQEVTASDALADLDRLSGTRHSKRGRT